MNQSKSLKWDLCTQRSFPNCVCKIKSQFKQIKKLKEKMFLKNVQEEIFAVYLCESTFCRKMIKEISIIVV